jgi:hypothetical protein
MLGDARDEFAAEFVGVQGLWEFLDPSFPVTKQRDNRAVHIDVTMTALEFKPVNASRHC